MCSRAVLATAARSKRGKTHGLSSVPPYWRPGPAMQHLQCAVPPILVLLLMLPTGSDGAPVPCSPGLPLTPCWSAARPLLLQHKRALPAALALEMAATAHVPRPTATAPQRRVARSPTTTQLGSTRGIAAACLAFHTASTSVNRALTTAIVRTALAGQPRLTTVTNARRAHTNQ